MNVAEKIVESVKKLPESKQIEILDFVEYLEHKNNQVVAPSDSDISLTFAMRGMEDEESPYTQNDLKEVY